MGIPSYFSYIIKNYPNIIRNLQYVQSIGLEHLYMDCNSLIYDAIRNNEYDPNQKTDFEERIIYQVIQNIKNIIAFIRPTKTIMIAFDGVAPFAKMQQQKTRRYKSQFMSDKETGWNTSAITPGTEFMSTLSKYVYSAFMFNERYYNVKRIVVSCSDIEGEGEQKIVKDIRSNCTKSDKISIYGLDSDLIMLGIFHLSYSQNIFVFREAPEFMKSSIPIQVQNEESNLYFLDIYGLSESILTEMNCVISDKMRIYDYVFMCFLLGNDFLPHFPAMNIRTHGITALMDIYRLHIGSKNKYFISDTMIIQWNNVALFIEQIAKNEHQFLLNEYFVRDKWDKRHWSHEEQPEILLNVPVIYREDEKYICPSEYGWEKRYYKTLFEDDVSIKNICTNYIEGLEWVFKYYTSECPNWRWKYKYHYPPLFNDLVKFIPHFNMDFIKTPSNYNAFTPELQLSFVLPPKQLKLLPKSIHDFLITHYKEYYPERYEFKWAFCRYFWEAHPLLPEIPLELLEQWDIQFRLHK